MDGSASQQRRAMGSGTRWLAVATVCVTAAGTLGTGGLLTTIPLILGVVAEALAPRRGKWLMWLGAAYLSVLVLPMEILLLPEFMASPLVKQYARVAIESTLWIASMCLIVSCDVALIMDAVKTRHNRIVAQRRLLGLGDWLVWTTAVCFTAYSFWGVPSLLRAYKHFNRIDILLVNLPVILILLMFDTLLLVDAVMIWRARGAENR